MKRIFAFIGFADAVTLIVLNIAGISICKYIMAAAAVLFIISLLLKKTRQAKVLPVVFGSALFACFIFMTVTYNTVAPADNLNGKTLNADFEIVDIYEKSDSGNYVYTVKTKSIAGSDAPQNIKVALFSKEEINADYYQKVSASLKFFSFADNGFDSYGNYGKGIYICASLSDYDVKNEIRKPVNYYIINLRLRIKEILNENFSDDVSALAVSIFTGDKSGLSADVINNFKICGVSHVMAVSGIHVTVICMGIYYFLKAIGCPKNLTVIVSLFFLFIYMGVADFRKSVLRAGIMMAVILLSRLISSQSDSLNSLGFAVFLICLNPFAVTDISALLTVCAVLGITVIMPELEKLYTFENRLLKYISEISLISVSITVATVPVLWIFFKSVSIMGIVLNIIFIPLFQIALSAVLIFVIFSLGGFSAGISKVVVDFSINLMLEITAFSAEHFSFLLLDLSGNLFGIAIAAVFLFMGIYLIVFKSVNTNLLSMFITVVFAVSMCVNYYNINTQTYLYIAENGGVIVYNRDCLAAFDVENNSDKYVIRQALIKEKASMVFVDCNISDEYNDADEIKENKDFSLDISEDVHIARKNNITIVNVYDKIFKIDDNCVTIGDEKFYRDVYGRFGESENIVLTVYENGKMIEERKNSG